MGDYLGISPNHINRTVSPTYLAQPARLAIRLALTLCQCVSDNRHLLIGTNDYLRY